MTNVIRDIYYFDPPIKNSEIFQTNRFIYKFDCFVQI